MSHYEALHEVDLVRRGIAASHDVVHRAASRLDDQGMQAPSRLPGWTRGHLLTHLARNADSVVRRLHAAERGELVDQYAENGAARTTEIERGAQRPSPEIIADLRAADDALDALIVMPHTWSRQVRRGSGDTATLLPAAELMWSRWREVEVHHVDLGLEHTVHDWPGPLVAWMLPRLLAGLGSRADERSLAAWALDRASAPRLSSWEA